jgi:hypothetical protein
MDLLHYWFQAAETVIVEKKEVVTLGIYFTIYYLKYYTILFTILFKILYYFVYYAIKYYTILFFSCIAETVIVEKKEVVTLGIKKKFFLRKIYSF